MYTVLNLLIIIFSFTMSIVFNAAGDGIKQRKFQTTASGISYHIYWALTILFLLISGIAYPEINDYKSLEGFYIISKLVLIYAMFRFAIFSPIRNIIKSTNDDPVHFLYIGETAWQDKVLTKLFGWNNFMKSVLFGIRWVTFFSAVALAKYFFYK